MDPTLQIAIGAIAISAVGWAYLRFESRRLDALDRAEQTKKPGRQ